MSKDSPSWIGGCPATKIARLSRFMPIATYWLYDKYENADISLVIDLKYILRRILTENNR